MEDSKLILDEIKYIRSSSDQIHKDLIELRIEVAKIKTEVKIKSSIFGACLGLVGPVIYYLKKHILN